jgi:hypothetical protein
VKAPGNDIEAALHALSLFHEPEDVIELRIISDGNRIDSGYFCLKNAPAIRKALASINGDAEGVYFVLNKLDPMLLARAANRVRRAKETTKDANILERRWLYIDIDPNRLSGISASEGEHQAALNCGEKIREFLAALGWPQPVIVDSGNGGHLYYRLPAIAVDAHGDALIKYCLAAIAAKFSDDSVKVDVVTDNRARITKLPGTMARKGDATPDRPHRLSKILEEPERVEMVSLDLLQHLAAEAPVPQSSPHEQPPTPSGRFDIEGWLAGSGLDIGRGPEPYDGGRRWILESCPFNRDHKKSAAVIQYASGALKFDCKHESCQQKDWRALRDLIEPDRKRNGPNAQAHARFDQSALDGWPEPIPLLAKTPEPISADILPGVLGEYSRALSRHTETPVDLSILAVLGATSAALAGKIEIEAEPGYIEPGHIWVCALLESGNRKTAVIDAVRAPIDDHQQAQQRRVEPEIKRLESERKSKVVMIDKLRKKLLPESSEKERRKIADLEAELPDERNSPTLVTSDVTPEALEVLMQENNGCMAIISDEGGMFDVMAGRYNSQPNLDVFLKGHTGGRVSVHRRSRNTCIPRAYLTMCLAPQPIVVQKLKDKPFMRERGLLARFLYAMPESPIGGRSLIPASIPGKTQANYRALIHNLLDLTPQQPIRLQSTTGAYGEWKDFQRTIEREMAEGGSLERLRDWGSKLSGAALRLAGMFCVADGYTSQREIQRDEIVRATALCTALIPHAVAAFGLVAEPPNVTAAKRILHWLSKQQESVISKRDCFRSLQRQFDIVSEMDAPLAILIDHSYIRVNELEARRAVLIEINPRWRRNEDVA